MTGDRPLFRALVVSYSISEAVIGILIMMKTSSSDIESIPDIINLKQYNQLY